MNEYKSDRKHSSIDNTTEADIQIAHDISGILIVGLPASSISFSWCTRSKYSISFVCKYSCCCSIHVLSALFPHVQQLVFISYVLLVSLFLLLTPFPNLREQTG